MTQTLTSETSTALTQFLTVGEVQYAYRKLGPDTGVPLLCLQHFTGTLDNWDPALIDPLAENRPVYLFENAGVGRSTGTTPDTIAGMAQHAIAFLDALGLKQVDVLGFSLGGFLAQYIALERPSLLRRIILAGTGPEGGEGVGMDRPELLAIFSDQQMPMSEKLQRLFFTKTQAGQTAGKAFAERLALRSEDKDVPATGEVAMNQLKAMAAWGSYEGERFAKLKKIEHPVLVTNGNDDIMIPTVNSFTLAKHLPQATLIIYPDSGHGALYQYASTFTTHVQEFLSRA